MSVFRRFEWGAPIPVSDQLRAMYNIPVDDDILLDNISTSMRKAGSAPIDYSQWDNEEVLTAPMLLDVIKHNAFTIYGMFSFSGSRRVEQDGEEMTPQERYRAEKAAGITYGELAEVVRRFPRIFAEVRDSSIWSGPSAFGMLLDQARRNAVDSDALIWILSEVMVGWNWWHDSIPFVRECRQAGVEFDVAVRFSRVQVHDVPTICEAVKQNVDPALLASL